MSVTMPEDESGVQQPTGGGPVIQANPAVAPVSARSDPFHAGLIPSPADRLMSADYYRRRPDARLSLGDAGGAGAGPLDLSGVGDVLGGAGYRAPEKSATPTSEGAQDQPAPRTIASDADEPTQGVFSTQDGSMIHLRKMTGPTAGSAGTYAASPVGSPGDGAVGGA